mgnify:CR=1 FL=1|jgi:hypothetical protein
MCSVNDRKMAEQDTWVQTQSKTENEEVVGIMC